jgi:hypothetical protein
MIARFLIWDDLHLCAKFPGFFRHKSTDAIHCGFVMGGRFGFDKEFEELG